MALVGESGCGKTTIVHAILGLLPPGTRTDGSIVLRSSDDERPPGGHDVDLVDMSPRAWRAVRGRRIGYVAQNPFQAFDPLRPVGHHVASAWTVHYDQPRPEPSPNSSTPSAAAMRSDVLACTRTSGAAGCCSAPR